jgi:hypothetical protein
MSTLDLELNHVFNIKMTVKEATSLIEDVDGYEGFTSALDKAIEGVDTDEQEVTYVVIKVVR